MRRTASGLTASALVFGSLAAASAATPRQDLEEAPRVAEAPMNCYFTITASNSGRSDVWVMLYESYVSNKNNWIFMARRTLKIQNYRVGPGKTIAAAYDAGGACWNLRVWHIKFKQGSNFAWKEYSTSDGDKLKLGDVSKVF